MDRFAQRVSSHVVANARIVAKAKNRMIAAAPILLPLFGFLADFLFSLVPPGPLLPRCCFTELSRPAFLLSDLVLSAPDPLPDAFVLAVFPLPAAFPTVLFLPWADLMPEVLVPFF